MLIANPVGTGVVSYFLDGRHPGRWSPGAGRLLGLDGTVDATDLRRVLEGRDPRNGRDLLAFRAGRRNAGWDLIFGAPKSVSLLAATADRHGTVHDAHVAAVAGITDHLDGRLHLRRGGPAHPAPAEGLIAAAFDHRSNAADEPHLHSHLLVANLSRSAGRWGAIGNDDWFADRRALGAMYQLELRHQLERAGWQLEWRLRPDGLADLADVPRAAVRAASTQSRRANRFAARGRTADGREPEPAGALASGGGWPMSQSPAAVTRRAGLEDPALERMVAVRLGARRSDFRLADVVVALAACHPGGASATETTRWAEEFCAQSRPVRSPTSRSRWTTPAAQRTDSELVEVLRARTGPRVAAEGPGAVERLTAGPEPVVILGAAAGRTELLAQAEVLAQSRTAWERGGLRAAVSSPTADAALRWQVLTGLPPHRPGTPTDVLVVDQADRRTASELSRLASRSGRLIFIEGGTLPRLTNPASHGLMTVADEVGRTWCPPHRPWVGSPDGSEQPGVGRQAALRLLERWQAAGRAPLLVALGVEEVRALNRAALGTERTARGPDRFRPGDRVVVLRGGRELPGYGTFGSVAEVGAGVGQGAGAAGVVFSWEDGTRTTTADRRSLQAIGFGYAVTPWLAASGKQPLMVLGPADSLARGRQRVVAEVPEVGVSRMGVGWERSPGRTPSEL